MAKSVYSQRDPLTPTELRRYHKKVKQFKALRKTMKDKFTFHYLRVFTEARSGGKCSTKFWFIRADQKEINRIKRFLNKEGIGIKITNRGYNVAPIQSLRLYM